jgi:hypothetical protein
MSRRLFTNTGWTPTATGDTTALANGTYMGLAANSATQQLFVTELFVQGMGTSSTNINPNLWARDSTLGSAGTPAALAAPATDGPVPGVYSPPSTLSLPFTSCTTAPQRSALTTAARLSLIINSLGGIARWKPADLTEAWWINGQTASTTESSLSGTTAGGALAAAQSASIMYEIL